MMEKTTEILYGYNTYLHQELPVYYIDNHVVVYEDLLTPFSKLLKNRIKDHHQNTIIVEGGTGSGKSTIGVQLCKMLDKNWSLENDYIYSSQDLKKKLEDERRGIRTSPVSLFDEGSVSLNSYNSQKSEDKQLTILMDAWRVRGMSMVICMPNRNDMNKRVRTNHVDYLIKCPVKSPIPGRKPRGFAGLYVHEYRDWADDWFKPIGITRFTKLDRKTQREYDEIKMRHLDTLIDKYIEEDEEE